MSVREQVDPVHIDLWLRDVWTCIISTHVLFTPKKETARLLSIGPVFDIHNLEKIQFENNIYDLKFAAHD